MTCRLPPSVMWPKGSSYCSPSLFQMPAQHLILVDTCNILHAVPEFRPRAATDVEPLAHRLLDRLRPLHDVEGWELHLVVDGKGDRLEQQFPGPERTLSLVYAPSAQSADAVICGWLLRLPAGWRCCVASADQAVRHSALASHAEVLSAGDLLAWAERAAGRARRKIAIPKKPFGNAFEELL